MPSCEFPVTVPRGYRALHRAERKWKKAGADPDRKPTMYVKARCGKCFSCITQKKMEWAFRLEEHQRVQAYPSYHVTLTYATEPPEGAKYSDFQKFMKRLRKRQYGKQKNVPEREKITYYVTSDYGSHNGRGHFHAILMNVKIDVGLLEDIWSHGQIKVSPMVNGTVDYVVDHALNKRFAYVPEGKNPIWHSQSRGIAKHLCSESWKKYLQDGNHFKFQHKYNIATPRYFAQKMDIDPYLLPYKPYMEEVIPDDNPSLKIYVDKKNSNSKRLIKALLKHVNN